MREEPPSSLQKALYGDSVGRMEASEQITMGFLKRLCFNHNLQYLVPQRGVVVQMLY